jgi:hypothetical protein
MTTTETETSENVSRGSIRQLDEGVALLHEVSASQSTLLATPLGFSQSISMVELMGSVHRSSTAARATTYRSEG